MLQHTYEPIILHASFDLNSCKKEDRCTDVELKLLKFKTVMSFGFVFGLCFYFIGRVIYTQSFKTMYIPMKEQLRT